MPDARNQDVGAGSQSPSATGAPPAGINDVIARLDLIITKIAFLGRLIAKPGRVLTVMLDAINLEESTDIPAIIRAFAGPG
jgi:hypothetical protein